MESTKSKVESIAEVMLLTEALSNLGEGVVITEDELNWPGPQIVFVNKAMCEITGYRPEELLGQTPRILQGESTDRATLDRIRRDLSAGRSCLAELINCRKDGSTYHAEVFITALHDAEGQRTNFVSIHRDISERKQSENEIHRVNDELARSISQLQLTQKTARIGFWDWNIAGEELTWDAPLLEMFGLDPDTKIEPADFFDHLHPDDRQKQERLLDDVFEKGAQYDTEFRIVRPDATTRWIAGRGDVIRDDHKQPSRMLGVNFDITERKRAEEAFQREHEFSENVIDTARTIVLVLDPEGRIVRFNSYFEELSGWSLEEATGRDWCSTFIPRREHKRIAKLFKKAVSGSRMRGNIHPIMTKEGGERSIEWYDSPLTNEAGDLVGLLCTGTDITERQLLEREVISATEEERQRIAHDLHDGLGSLLTGIKLRIEALSASLPEEDGPRAESSAAIADMIRDAMAKTREIARGLRPVGDDPEDLMSALQSLRAQINSTTDLRCRVRCPEPVLVDEPMMANHLFRIAQEAVTNVVKHGGASRLIISLTKGDDAIELKVGDDGTGIDRDADTKGGLGMHIMNYRARAINGSLHIKRRRKGGTNVVCTVPTPSRKK